MYVGWPLSERICLEPCQESVKRNEYTKANGFENGPFLSLGQEHQDLLETAF
jgi:hypothetical protein